MTKRWRCCWATLGILLGGVGCGPDAADDEASGLHASGGTGAGEGSTGGTDAAPVGGTAGVQATGGQGAGGGALTGDRVTRYAVVVAGPGYDSLYYQAISSMVAALEDRYGYPREAVYCLVAGGRAQGPIVDGASSFANFERVMSHLASITQPNDQVFFYLIGHGNQMPYWELLNGQGVIGDELSAFLDALPTQNVSLALNFCQSGAFVPYASGPGRVVLTSTLASENNAVGWAERVVAALAGEYAADSDGDGRVSLKETYDATVGMSPAEHPLLDDDGDGVGHNGTAAVVDGDGALAARTFLGLDGARMEFPQAAVDALAAANAGLELD